MADTLNRTHSGLLYVALAGDATHPMDDADWEEQAGLALSLDGDSLRGDVAASTDGFARLSATASRTKRMVQYVFEVETTGDVFPRGGCHFETGAAGDQYLGFEFTVNRSGGNPELFQAKERTGPSNTTLDIAEVSDKDGFVEYRVSGFVDGLDLEVHDFDDGVTLSGTGSTHNVGHAGIALFGGGNARHCLWHEAWDCEDRVIVCTELLTGHKLKVRGAGGTVLAEDTETAGTATVPLIDVALSAIVDVVVTDGADAVQATFTPASGDYVAGGDTYEFEEDEPPPPPPPSPGVAPPAMSAPVTTARRSFTINVYEQGEGVGGTVDFTITPSMLVEPPEIGGTTSRVLDGTSESMPYAIKFIDPTGAVLAKLWTALGTPAVIGRVVEVVMDEDGVPATVDVRRLERLRVVDAPVPELHLVDELQADNTRLFESQSQLEFNPTLQALPPGPSEDWGDVPAAGAHTVDITDSSGDFREITFQSGEGTRRPQKEFITGDVVVSPQGSNTSGNFKHLVAALDDGGFTDRPVVSFGALSADTKDQVLNLDNWTDFLTTSSGAELVPPPFWVHWPGGPTSGTTECALHFGDAPASADLPWLIEAFDLRALFTLIFSGSFGGGSMRSILPSSDDLPGDRLGGEILLMVTRPMKRVDFLRALAKLAGAVLWFDDEGRIRPKIWDVPRLADFTQQELGALYHFDRSTALSPPTYEVKQSDAFNVWRAEGIEVNEFGQVGSLVRDSPFRGQAVEQASREHDDTANSPITDERVVYGAGLDGLVVSDLLVSSATSVGALVIEQVLGGLAYGRIHGHATADAPQPGDVVVIDHDDLKGLNPDTGDRSGEQIARVVDRRRVYGSASVHYEYRLIYGGLA